MMVLTSYRIYAEKIDPATAEIVNDSAGIWKNRFASDATITRISPINRNFPMKEKSRFVTVALPAVAQARGARKDRRQDHPGNEREAEQRHHAPAAVAQQCHHEQRSQHRRE